MDSINLNKSTLAERETENSECLNLSEQSNTTSTVSCEMIKTDASLIERELITSLKLIESGLAHLDIKAAHLLNQQESKLSYTQSTFGLPSYPKIKGRIDIQYSSKSSKSSTSTASKSKDLFNGANKNVYSTSKLDGVVQDESKRLIRDNLQLLNPPALTFSFYSSKEYIIPSAPLASSDSLLTTKNVIPSAPSASPTSIEASYFSGNRLESQTNKETEQLLSKSNLEPINSTLKPSGETAETIIRMNDIAESLLKIKSALDNLDKEAAYLLNPLGYKLSVRESSTEASSTFKNNELYPLEEN